MPMFGSIELYSGFIIRLHSSSVKVAVGKTYAQVLKIVVISDKCATILFKNPVDISVAHYNFD